MKVLDDDGNECPPGVVGEIYMRPSPGSAPTYRYIGATAKSRDGWDSLGDLGYFDEDGFLYLNDRRVDMFTVGGRNVYPAEIESALSAHPNVLSCLVVGVPDEDLGQVPHAIVQADGLDEAAVMAFLSERIASLQGAPHRRVQRHPVARRRRQGAPVGGARRDHRATGSGAFVTALSSGGTGRPLPFGRWAPLARIRSRNSQRRSATRHGDSTSA